MFSVFRYLYSILLLKYSYVPQKCEMWLLLFVHFFFASCTPSGVRTINTSTSMTTKNKTMSYDMMWYTIRVLWYDMKQTHRRRNENPRCVNVVLPRPPKTWNSGRFLYTVLIAFVGRGRCAVTITLVFMRTYWNCSVSLKTAHEPGPVTRTLCHSSAQNRNWQFFFRLPPYIAATYRYIHLYIDQWSPRCLKLWTSLRQRNGCIYGRNWYLYTGCFFLIKKKGQLWDGKFPVENSPKCPPKKTRNSYFHACNVYAGSTARLMLIS